MHLLELHLFLSMYHNEFKDDLEFLIPLEYWITCVLHLPQVYVVLRTEPRASCLLVRHTTNGIMHFLNNNSHHINCFYNCSYKVLMDQHLKP